MLLLYKNSTTLKPDEIFTFWRRDNSLTSLTSSLAQKMYVNVVIMIITAKMFLNLHAISYEIVSLAFGNSVLNFLAISAA